MRNADKKADMPNFLWFKPDGGGKKYAEYPAAAGPFVAELGGVMIDVFRKERAVIKESNTDFFFIVERPNSDAFLMLPQNPESMKIANLRDEALTNPLMIKCNRVGEAQP